MKRLLIIILMFACFSITFSQQWINNFNHTIGGVKAGEDKAYAITVDDEGFIYLAGFITSFDTKYDFATVKIDPNGNILWARLYNGNGNLNDKAYAITVDDLDNVIVTGFATEINSNINIITIKYSPNGDSLWTRFYDGQAHGEDKAYAISTDESDNIYVAGSSESSANGLDYIIIKYNSSGNTLWTRTYNGTGNNLDVATAMAVDKDDNPVVTGYSRNGTTESTEDIVTIKLNKTNGNFIWINRFNGDADCPNQQDKAYAITVDRFNYIYATGFSVQNSNHGKDIVTICYNPNGDRKWARTWNNSDHGNGDDIAYSVAATNNNNVIVCGSTIRYGHEDFITLDYHTNNSNLKWEERYGTQNGIDIAYSLAVSNSNKEVFVTGACQHDTASNIFDIVTIKYKIANGDQLDLARFNNNGTDKTIPTGVVVDGSDNIIIAGYRVPFMDDSRPSTILENSSIIALKYSMGALSHQNHFNLTEPKVNRMNLFQNFPNPFNPSTLIKFYLPASAPVKLTVYDMLGKEVGTLVNGYLNAGEHSAVFNGEKLSSGIYLYVLNVNGVKDIKRMILIK
jgi:uncharacterized delta-60 repeat protein